LWVAAGRPRLAGMAGRAQASPDEAQSSRFGLDLQLGCEPIKGRVYEDGGRLNRPFCGWLGLMAAIEAAREVEPVTQREPTGAAR
jgi:hypothetical protein